MARGALDRVQAGKIKAAVLEVVDDLAEYDDTAPARATTQDPEAAAAVEAAHAAEPDLPVLERAELVERWQADAPVLCVAGRSPLDEAAAAMLAQLLEKHGLGARVEGSEAVLRANIPRLETSGVALVCLSYLDAGSPAHIRYLIRRVRRRLPQAHMLLACWKTDADAASLRDATKPDALATTLRDAVKLCLDAAMAAEASRTAAARPPGADANAAFAGGIEGGSFIRTTPSRQLLAK